MIVGIPRALLFHVFADLWVNYFKNLGVEVFLSPQTNKEIIKKGVNNSIDEGCYSSKVFIGHVEYLLNKCETNECDMIFVPRIENSAIREEYCARIFGVYDLVKNTFPSAKLLSANVNYLYRKRESDAFVEIGAALGKTKEQSMQAYNNAVLTANKLKEDRIAAQEELLKSDGTKVLIVSHAYNTQDASIGKGIIDFFEKNNIKIAYAEVVDDKEAKTKAKQAYDGRIYWKLSAQIVGGIETYKDLVDGIVLISTFPCGPDSIFNELAIRTIKDKPILSLIIDEQDASAGIETRLESFTDIIMAKKRGLSI